MVSVKTIWLLLSLRLLIGLTVRGYFSPDQYWQSLEVAHSFTFGYGHLTWQWQDQYRIRSIFHPSLFILLYELLKLYGLDTPYLIAYLPRLLQASLLLIFDICMLKSFQILGKPNLQQFLLLFLSSWFVNYAGVRTYGNSLQMVLNALSIWLYLQGKMNRWNISIGFSCLIRPTSVINWIGVFTRFLWEKNWIEIIRTAVFGQVLFSVGFLAFQVAIDSIYYKKLTFTFYNFLEFNFLSGNSGFYGVHSWYWYFLDGIPVVMLSYVGLLVIGTYKYWIYQNSQKRYPFLLVNLLCGIFILSNLSHKQYRFLLPLMPNLILISGFGLQSFKPIFIRLFIICQIGVFFYFSLFHQVGPLQVMDTLQHETPTSIAFWINCHGNPFYSHIHRQIPMDFLHCQPLQFLYSSEPTQEFSFFQHPQIQVPLLLQKTPYSHIVVWQSLYTRFQKSFNEYSIKHRIFHAHYGESPLGYERNIHFLILKRNQKCLLVLQYAQLLQENEVLKAKLLQAQATIQALRTQNIALSNRLKKSHSIVSEPEKSDQSLCQICGRQVPTFNLEIHKTHCAKNFLNCPACNELILKRDLEVHMENLRGGVKDLVVDIESNNIGQLLMRELHGADLHVLADQRSGNSLLHIAGLTNFTDMVAFLLEKNLDINTRNKYGESTVHFVCSRTKNIEMVKFLVSRGANYLQPNSMGESAIEAAQRNGFHEAVLYLSQVGRSNQRVNTSVGSIRPETKKGGRSTQGSNGPGFFL